MGFHAISLDMRTLDHVFRHLDSEHMTGVSKGFLLQVCTIALAYSEDHQWLIHTCSKSGADYSTAYTIQFLLATYNWQTMLDTPTHQWGAVCAGRLPT